MVKEVLDGISIKLNAIFGDGVQIYADRTCKGPAFLLLF